MTFRNLPFLLVFCQIWSHPLWQFLLAVKVCSRMNLEVVWLETIVWSLPGDPNYTICSELDVFPGIVFSFSLILLLTHVTLHYSFSYHKSKDLVLVSNCGGSILLMFLQLLWYLLPAVRYIFLYIWNFWIQRFCPPGISFQSLKFYLFDDYIKSFPFNSLVLSPCM
jgi:hypothetical protein